MFIAIEGVDAAGKHTQSKLLADKLGAKLHSFPDYSTPMGHLIEGHLKRYWSAQADQGTPEGTHRDAELLNAYVFQALQLTNRMEHAVAIREAQDDGEHIVADRYWPSGWVYGQADGLDPEWLLRVQEYLPGPDLYLLLDIDPAQSAARRPERRDRYEEQEGLMQQAAELYRRLWREQEAIEDGHWVVIDGNGTVGDVHQQIITAVEEYVDRVLFSVPAIKPLPWRAA